MNFSKTILASAGIAAASFVAVPAFAATAGPYYDTDECKTSDLSTGPFDCYGSIEPTPVNDANADLEGGKFYFSENDYDISNENYTIGLFGKTDWNLLAKADIPEGGSVGTDGDLTVTVGGQDDPWDGSWTYTGTGSYDYFAIILKQSNTFSAYLFEDENGSVQIASSGLWDTTTGVFSTNAGGLSHMSIWYGSETVNEVPLPAAAWLLLGGLGGLAALRRRKTS